MAVGETWRRLVGKALSGAVIEELRLLLEPTQLGVGTRGGAEALVHTTRQWLHRNRDDPQKIRVTLDLENAFNSIDRSAVLAAVRRAAPGLTP